MVHLKKANVARIKQQLETAVSYDFGEAHKGLVLQVLQDVARSVDFGFCMLGNHCRILSNEVIDPTYIF